MVRASHGNSRLRLLRRRGSGFALITSLLLLMLIVIVALGLLQLATISLRSVDQEGMLSQARANARLSLMLAIGQLQQELGPDRRISAPAGMLDASPSSAAFDGVEQPHWTGVWTATESPFTKWTLDRPSYDKKAGFRRWLVSGNPEDVGKLDLAVNGPSTGAQTSDPVSNGADAAGKRGVSVPVVQGLRSGFAWWTSDNGVKAVLRPGEKPDSSSKADTILTARRADSNGHAVIDPKLPDRDHGMDRRLVDLATVDAAISTPAGNQRAAWKYIHDLTTHSETVPVDVTNGGLRKCMNLYLDWLGTQSPAARAAAGTVGKMRNASMDCRLFSWDQLRNYQSIARAGSMLRINPTTGRPVIRCHGQTGFSSSDGEPEWNPNIGNDRFRIQPVLLKMSYVISYSTEKVNGSDKPYALRLYIYPMAVLWNPYNVDLEVPEYCAAGSCPLSFDINMGSSGNVKVDLNNNNSGTMLAFGPEMGGAEKMTNLLIPAGSTKVLYPQPVRWSQYPDEHRNPRFRWHYYVWAQSKTFNLGDSNFGGVLKNLRSNSAIATFDSVPSAEITGGASETLKIAVTPSSGRSVSNTNVNTFGIDGTHSDWWGNNGPGTDNAATLQKFGSTTSVKFTVESDKSTPQVSVIADSELPSRTFGQLEGRPTPLLFFECFRKAADEDLFPAKHGSFSISGNPIQSTTAKELGTSDAVTPFFESPYTFRFRAINSWMDVTKSFQLPPGRDDHVYFGASYSTRGQLSVVDQEIPLGPLVSLAQLQHLPLFDYRPTYDPATAAATTQWYGGDYGFHEGRVTQFPQNHAIGNSYASPGIPSDKLNNRGWRYAFNIQPNGAEHLRVDRSYIANSVLWDSWFCSSIGAQDGLMLVKDGTKRSARQVAEELFNKATPPPDDAIAARPAKPVAQFIDSLFGTNGAPAKDAYQKIAEHIRIEGGFNVNSVSVEAWTHFLSGLLSRPQLVMESVSGGESPSIVSPESGKFLIARYSLSNASPAERAEGNERENRYWNGSREITAGQIRELATAIVVQVKKRGPFLSLAEFVNRRISRDADLAVSGALQSALDDSSVSINQPFRGDVLSGTERVSTGRPTYSFSAAAKGPKRQGITGYVTQADLLQSLGPCISPRSDTFTVRAMGEARDGNGKVRSRVWCEAVVQRTAEYVDPSDVPSTPTTSLKQSANVQFGRRFEIVSFRWLDPREIRS